METTKTKNEMVEPEKFSKHHKIAKKKFSSRKLILIEILNSWFIFLNPKITYSTFQQNIIKSIK